MRGDIEGNNSDNRRANGVCRADQTWVELYRLEEVDTKVSLNSYRGRCDQEMTSRGDAEGLTRHQEMTAGPAQNNQPAPWVTQACSGLLFPQT